MIPINIIFKIIKYHENDKSISIKTCRQNSPKPIDEYPSMRISLDKLDFSSVYNLQESLRDIATNYSLMQLSYESTLPENECDEELDSVDMDDIIDKILVFPNKEEGMMQQIEL
tara:strand:+ start:2886 stop:3227 length:342 start_codon:yes stop_codon:yes gene_type:complete